jgi:hypothetical protein
MSVDEGNGASSNNNLSLKSEFESIYYILAIHATNIENTLKQQNFCRKIFQSVENPNPENFEFWNNGICFDFEVKFKIYIFNIFNIINSNKK